MADEEKPDVSANDVVEAVKGESETARKSRQARERGRARRAAAINRGKEARKPAVERGEAIRKPAVERGEQIRLAPQLRGEIRRAEHTNRTALPPPPASGGEAETARALHDAAPLQRVLKGADRLRGRQNQ